MASAFFLCMHYNDTYQSTRCFLTVPLLQKPWKLAKHFCDRFALYRFCFCTQTVSKQTECDSKKKYNYLLLCCFH